MDKELDGFQEALGSRVILEWFAAPLGLSQTQKKQNPTYSHVDSIESF